MTKQVLDLMQGGIQHSNLFMHMPLFDEIQYLGFDETRVRRYRAFREGQSCQILALNIIRHDESDLWKAVEDFIKRATKDASMVSHGVYVFDLLTIDVHKEIQTFDINELTQLIMNHARKIQPGEQRLIKYSSCYGLLQKMIHEEWGKITLKTSVEVFKDKPEMLDLVINRIMKKFDYAHEPTILLLNDVSLNPVFDQSNELQQNRLKKMMDKRITNTMDFLPEFYIQDRHGVRELLSESTIV